MKCCRRSSLDWQSAGGMSRRLSSAGNFSNRASGLGLAESDGGIQTYHNPLSQTFTAVDFDMQVPTYMFLVILTMMSMIIAVFLAILCHLVITFLQTQFILLDFWVSGLYNLVHL